LPTWFPDSLIPRAEW
jgi:ABC-type multidrug transport system, ATPase and permease components